MNSVTLRNARLQATILPQAGGGVARLDWLEAGQSPIPVLRPFTGEASAPPVNQLGCFLLVPWSNRIDGGITCGGSFYPIERNRPGERYPIHGHGWQHPWTVEQQSETQASLLLALRGFPYSFDARAHYQLDGQALDVILEVVNAGQFALPFGLGLHPYLPRSAGVTLQARAPSVWRRGPNGLPQTPCELPRERAFAEPRTLPADVIDHVFEGWDGRAQVHWPETGLRLAIEADARYYIVYTPANADFFCFEPVDHRINAHHGDGGPERHGLTILAPGATLRRSFRFVVSR